VFSFTARFGRAAPSATTGEPDRDAGRDQRVPHVADNAGPAPATRCLRLLIAEDNAVNQKVARGILTKLGHAISIVNDGHEALAAWQAGSFDVILMDCQMPVMDGFEATREIRRRELAAGVRIPIIALTADAMQGTDAMCRAAGMDDYLTKPLNLAKLRATLERLVPVAPQSIDLPPSIDTPPPVDMHRLLELTDGDAQFSDELIAVFVASGDLALDQIRMALQRGDLTTVGRTAHSFKGSSANIFARSASAAAGRLETAAINGDAAGLTALEEELRREAAIAMTYLQAQRRGQSR
jgi:CheY-like chemotaxis protein/HPt (histidine-containing phosphotransfer) domain-containing protein